MVLSGLHYFYHYWRTCKLNNIDPFEYLCDEDDRIYDCPACDTGAMSPPHKWKKENIILRDE